MGWILLLTIMSHNQGSMTTIQFADQKSCLIAGERLKEAANKDTPLFKSTIRYHCVMVGGLK